MSTNKNKKTGFSGPSSRSVKGSVRKSIPPTSIDSQSRMKKSIYGGASRTVLSSSSRKNVQLGTVDKFPGPAKPPVQVFDDEGHDVTPLPLNIGDANALRQRQSNIVADSSAGTPTDLMSQASMYQTGTVTASTFGGGPFTRSVFSASQSGRSTGSLTDDLVEPAGEVAAGGWAEAKVQVVRQRPPPEEVSEEDLVKIEGVELTETETIFLLDLPGICVSLESDEAATVREQNIRYQELMKSRVGNDRYIERSMNTFNNAPKSKNVQTTKITYADAGMMVSEWDKYDTYKLLEEMEAKAKAEEEEEEEGQGSRPISSKVDEKSDKEKEGDRQTPGMGTQTSKLESQATAMSSLIGTDSVFGSKETGVTLTVQEQKEIDENAVLTSDDLRWNMVIMERAVNMNTYQPRQASFRSLKVVTDVDQAKPEVEEEKPPKTPGSRATSTPAKALVLPDQDLGPGLDRLWAYQCSLTKGRNTSCIAWNKSNPDLLAVGYGQYEFTKQKSGLVCCWSLKNPEFPERVYTFNVGVTSLDFSQAHPNLLAVGLYDGTVAICNVRSLKDESILDSFEANGKHTGPVWQLRWIEKERGSGEERAEVLVSVSTDGRVTQWSIRKGFESYDLMKLKRVQTKLTQAGRAKKTEALISKHAGGLCFDFNHKDSNIYLAGTEEGHIHRCSCSYNEQYLDSYFGHTGPIYKIGWSPFCPDIFLSCSGDWSIRLWHQDRIQPVLNFFSSTKSVPDMAWSPHRSTVFACVNEGAVEVWDLSQNILDPVIVTTPPQGTKLGCVSFARNSNCVLVGDSEGGISVYQLHGMPIVSKDHQSQAETLMKVVQSSLASQLQQKQ